MTKKDASADVPTSTLPDLTAPPSPVYSEPDSNDLRWRHETVGKKIRVFVLTESGDAFNVLADTEAEGKKVLIHTLGVK